MLFAVAELLVTAAHAYAQVIIFCLGSFFSFRMPSSEVTRKGFNKLYHMVGNESDLNMGVQNFKVLASPLKRGLQNCLFLRGFVTTSRLKHENPRKTWVELMTMEKNFLTTKDPAHALQTK